MAQLTTRKRNKSSLSSSLEELAQSLFDSATISDPDDDSIFAEEPVDIETFLYSPDYLNLSIRLSKPQIDFVDNCSRIYGSPVYTEGVLQCGQGSGKDTCSVFLCLRLVYLLQCLKSPQRYFGMGDKSYIDIINIAPNALSAKNIFFDSLVSYMKESPWFQQLKNEGKEYKATTRLITFPKTIRLVSGNSDNESWQGYTPILVVLDEIDAFKSELELQTNRSLRSKGAAGVYDTANSLVQSRFPNVGKVLCLSWPRFKGSFIQQRFLRGKKEEQTYVPCREDGKPYATWDFNPIRKQEDYVSFYIQNPILARARYECDPGYATNAFFRDINYVLDAFDSYIDDYEEISWAGQRQKPDISSLNKKRNYYAHVDLALSEANAALCITHRDGDNIVVDVIEAWEPPIDGNEIDIKGIEDYILAIHQQGYKILQCTYDSFQSASSLQTLEKAGILASRKSVDRTLEPYHTLKDEIQQGRLIGFHDKDVITELLSLDIMYNNKVVNRPGMLKDRADAVAGAVHNAVLAAGTLRMKGVSNINDVFAETQEEENQTILNPQTGQLNPVVNKQGLVVMRDNCLDCNNINTLEYADYTGNRTNEASDAVLMKCLYCYSKWVKEEDTWIQVPNLRLNLVVT